MRFPSATSSFGAQGLAFGRASFYICIPKSLYNMPKSRSCLLLFLLLGLRAAAQYPDDEYYPYAEREERVRTLLSDTTLFYRALQLSDDRYGDWAAFDLPQVAIRRRGEPRDRRRTLLDGVEVSYRHAAVLRLLGGVETRRSGIAPAPERGGDGSVCAWRFGCDEPLQPYRVAVRLAERDYLAGARLSAARAVGRGWHLSAAADLRTGRDRRIEGVFTDAATAAVRVAKAWREGAELSLTAVLPLSVRGLRLSSVEEAFVLTGDRLYNPAWGWQDGKVRNSRVRREWLPAAVGRWTVPLTGATRLEVSAGIEGGIRRYSALGWYDARTPMPDNYRHLPSWTGDGANEEAWRSADARYTQIDWEGMIAANRMAGGAAHYALEDRVTRTTCADGRLWMTTQAGPRLILRYGIEASCDLSRDYKQLRDLLGAEYLPDIDQFLVDDDTYGNRLQNDLRRPGRLATEGDRFGYDYGLATLRAGASVGVEYRTDRLRAAADGSFGSVTVRRRGYFEKELFAGDRSLGPSRKIRFAPYALRAAVGWSFSPRSYLELAARAAAEAPDPASLFVQPLYNNRTIDDPRPRRRYDAELRFRRSGEVLTWELAAFASASFDGVETRRYYDDMAGRYCDATARGIAQSACGAEAAAEVRLGARWQLALTAAGGRYAYIRNPRLTVLSDSDNTAVDSDAECYLGGCRTGGVPHATASLRIVHFAPRGWGFRLSAGYAGWRYVEPAFVRRTARVAMQGSATPEALAGFMRQERLDDAVTLDAALFKSFYFAHSRLTLSCTADNLLGGVFAYDGYESLRVGRSRSGTQTVWYPHATRYTYAYPRSVAVTVGYTF